MSKKKGSIESRLKDTTLGPSLYSMDIERVDEKCRGMRRNS